jgi:hypothetical protein
MAIETKTDKKIESINALKNANKHLADLFSEMAKKDQVLQSQSTQLSYVARQCGDICVMVFAGSDRKAVSLKTFLEAAATALNEAR